MSIKIFVHKYVIFEKNSTIKYINIIPILFLAITFNACKKETKTIEINSELKAAFNYQPGTYWIYRDSVSGRIHSFFYADRIEGGTTYHNGLLDIIKIDIFIKAYNINPLPALTSNRTWQYTMEDNELSLTSARSDTVYFPVRIDPILNYPYQDQITNRYNIGTFEDVPSIQKMDSYTINGFTFNNVAIANHRNAAGTVNYTFYFSPEVGFFKIRMYDPANSMDNVWELVRYNIVK